MSKIIHFTKSHWKKIGIASVPIIYGINYTKTEHEISKHMRYVCNDVKHYAVPNKNTVLVVLNPVANKKKCEKMFQKYCEPILHMAGYSVEIVKTKHIGHAKSLVETLQKLPDAVVIAGGDGTASEVTTGLLRRNDESCPILFLPLGENNETAANITQMPSKGKLEYVKYLSGCLLALVKERVQYRNAIKYQVILSEEKQESRKPIFGLNQFSWGLLRHIEVNKDKYWYFSGLRYHAAAIIFSLSNEMNWNISAKLACTPPCPGCNKCRIETKNKTHYFFPKLFTPKINTQPPSTVVINNEFCGKVKDYYINAKQVNISCKYNELNTEVIEEIPSRLDFIKNVITGGNQQPSEIFKCRTIELSPITTELLTYYIDGEEYDARAIKISFLPNAVKYFC